MTLDTVQSVPIRQWQDGSIRVRISGTVPRGDLRVVPVVVLLRRGYLSVIAYYITHKSEIDRYLVLREKESDEIWKAFESDPKHVAFRAQLKKRKEAYLNIGSK